MRVLVTGGAGFIGHNVAIYLAHRGFDVTVYDTLERSSGDAVRILRDAGIPIYRRDVREWHDLRGYDVVVHCAAYVDVAGSFARPKEYFENNVIGTASIAKAASDAGGFFIYI
jgi:nucleoside-diphosphate-sugar epimerase